MHPILWFLHLLAVLAGATALYAAYGIFVTPPLLVLGAVLLVPAGAQVLRGLALDGCFGGRLARRAARHRVPRAATGPVGSAPVRACSEPVEGASPEAPDGATTSAPTAAAAYRRTAGLGQRRRALPRVPWLPSLPEEIRGLLPFLEGQTVSVTKTWSGTLEPLEAFVLIRAPRAVVWRVLTDVAALTAWMPKMTKAEITETLPDGTRMVVYELDTPLRRTTGLERQRLKPEEAFLIDEVGGDYLGKMAYRLFTLDDGRTVIQHRSFVNVTAANPLLRTLLKSDPAFESALNLSAVVLRLEALQKRAETLAAGE